jgi:hypothetical protein
VNLSAQRILHLFGDRFQCIRTYATPTPESLAQVGHHLTPMASFSFCMIASSALCFSVSHPCVRKGFLAILLVPNSRKCATTHAKCGRSGFSVGERRKADVRPERSEAAGSTGGPPSRAEFRGLALLAWELCNLAGSMADPKSVQGQMRHSRISTTMDI